MSPRPRVVRLLFERAPNFGSREHYFHFVWGYLLPALDQILSESWDDVVFEFESCGPAMNPRIREVCTLLEIPYHLGIRASARDPDAEIDERYVARWDCWLRSPDPKRVPLAVERHRSGTPEPVLDAMDRVIDHLLSAAGCGESKGSPGSAVAQEGASRVDGVWLLLRRSEEPPFYGPDGAAEKKNYGVGRRAIANLEELAEQLNEQGLPVHVYEPGLDSLIQQIRTFHHAEGVIGVRGAEFANIAWMRPGRTALMLKTPKPSPHHLVDGLAATRGGHLEMVRVDSNYPEVSAHAILSALVARGAISRVGS